MYYIQKRLEVAGAHKLDLSYGSPCENIHGHNWIITVFCKAETVNADGMLIDFKRIKELVHSKLDHKFLNDVFCFHGHLVLFYFLSIFICKNVLNTNFK